MKRTPLTRKSPIRRSAAPKPPRAPKAPIPKKNPARAKLALARAFGGPERIAWIQAQLCVACGREGCQNAHVRSGGAGRRADARWVVPLCPTCHALVHSGGQASFERAHQIDLFDLAVLTEARWEQYVARNSPWVTLLEEDA